MDDAALPIGSDQRIIKCINCLSNRYIVMVPVENKKLAKATIKLINIWNRQYSKCFHCGYRDPNVLKFKITNR